MDLDGPAEKSARAEEDENFNEQIRDMEMKEPFKGWDVDKEKILIEWADKAMSYKWMHDKSHQHYKCVHAWFTIPVIVMSTLGGIGNFGIERFSADHQGYMNIVIGTIAIAAGMITTISQFLKVSEVKEGHRAGNLAWDKLYRDVKIVMAKRPEHRKPASDQINIFKEIFDRQMEISPPIEQKVITAFNSTVIDPNFHKPEICGEMKSTGEMNTVHFYQRKTLVQGPLALSTIDEEVGSGARIQDITVSVQ